MDNQFLTAVRKHDTYTENFAISNSTSGSALVNYFTCAGTYRNRPQSSVNADISAAWAESPQIALQLIFYLRLITRKTKGFASSETVQKGQGVRDEYRKALVWVVTNHPEFLYKNFWLLPTVGSWKDLWHTDLIDVLDRQEVYQLIKTGLHNEYNRQLLAKYLPKIRSLSNVKNKRHENLNQFARGFCAFIGWSERSYRKFKSTGKAHDFQQKMSNNLWDNLEFNKIPGKALFNIVNNIGKDHLTTLQRHNLEDKYLDWIKKQPVAKFTGYPYELMKAAGSAKVSLVQRYTINKQFNGLLELAKQDTRGLSGNVWCALDTSGSMGASITDKVTAFDVCVSLGIYFSALNTGNFKDNVIMFDDVSKIMSLSGEFVDKVEQVRNASTAWGSTNFQSVIDEIVRVRNQNRSIPIKDYPTTLLVVSDMQFNPSNCNASAPLSTLGYPQPISEETNYETAMRKLTEVGLPKIQVIWWQVNARKTDMPSTIEDSGTTLIGGFDGSIITTILGGDQTIVDVNTGETRQLNPYENMLKALNQEILTQVKLPVS